MFNEERVCTRDERCVAGACEALPEVYGNACRGRQESAACAAAGLRCGGVAAILFCLHPGVEDGVNEPGEVCYGSRDCRPGLLCTLTGRCSAGALGDPCRDDDDCLGVCVAGACGAG